MMPPSSITPFSEGLFGSVVLPPSVELEGFEPFEGLPPSVEFEVFEGLLPLVASEGSEEFEVLLPESLPLPEPLPDPPLSVGSVESV